MPRVVVRRGVPVGGLIVGAAVGSRMARNRADAREQQAYQQQELEEAEREADEAKERAHQAELAAKDAEIAAQGKYMLSAAYAQPVVAQPVSYGAPPPAMAPPPALAPPPAIAPQKVLLVTSPHIVNESDPAMQAHGIISVPAGEKVGLVQGTLTGGLGGPYADYITVSYHGKTGKISRLVVVEA